MEEGEEPSEYTVVGEAVFSRFKWRALVIPMLVVLLKLPCLYALNVK